MGDGIGWLNTATTTPSYAVYSAAAALSGIGKRQPPGELDPIPGELLPNERKQGNSGFRVLLYGMRTFGDLFSARQKLALTTLAKHASRPATNIQALALAISRLSDYGSAQATWVPSGEFVRGTFGRQALPMVWDFAEAVPWTDSSGNVDGAIDWVALGGPCN